MSTAPTTSTIDLMVARIVAAFTAAPQDQELEDYTVWETQMMDMLVCQWFAISSQHDTKQIIRNNMDIKLLPFK